MSIALAIIAKDQFDNCKKIIEKYGKYFDEVCIAYDDKQNEFIKLELIDKVRVFKYEWINDFSHKRNFLAEKVSSTFYLRLDTDDEIENPEIIAEIAKAMEVGNFDVFYVPYIYAKDHNGDCVAKHWRETIIRKKEGVYWKKPIHENVFIEKQEESQILRHDGLKIIHNIDEEHALESYKRNFSYLLEEFKRDGAKTDPRTIAYIGRMLMVKGMWDKAVLFLENLTKRSGWDDDKYFAWIQMAQCYQQMGKLDIAIGCCNEALALNTRFPDAYLQMGALYLEKQEYVKAVDWIMPGLVRPEPDTVMVVDPTFYTYKAKINAALALLGKGDIELAMQYYQEAKKLAPKDNYILGLENMFVDAHLDDKYIRHLAWMASYVSDKDNSKLQSLIQSMPKDIFKDERAVSIRNNFIQPKVWENNSIVFYCGQAWEDWAAPSVLKGIGGSEEATIYLSKELVKLGYRVTIFNSCGEMAGTYDGVDYVPYNMINLKDKFNIFISWRQQYFTDLNARVKLVWLHDVPSDDMFTEDKVKLFDNVIVLSEFHKSLLPKTVPEDKVFVSSNGINIEDFKSNGTIRNPHRAIYTSSYDRGLQHLLEMWPDVRKEVPDAELHIYYGWDTYNKMVAVGGRPIEFKNAMVALMNQPGVFEHGRIGHKQLNKEFQKSGVWAYPTHFEEISCISAMKAQANGCVPVCTNYAALNETVKAGVKIEGRLENGNKEEYKKRLIETLSNGKCEGYDEGRQDVLRVEVLKHKDEFAWELVAKQWAEGVLR